MSNDSTFIFLLMKETVGTLEEKEELPPHQACSDSINSDRVVQVKDNIHIVTSLCVWRVKL